MLETAILRGAAYRATGWSAVLSLTVVLLAAPCRMMAAAPAPHDCCDQHCNHEQPKSSGCETVCEAKSSRVLISPTVELAPASGGKLLPTDPEDHVDRTRNRFPVDPRVSDSSPPLYLKNAAFLI